ncbi:hypothetical protein Q6286_25910, partial [Klebsiella pneumoniae]|nr:hypothetical protein [Klebsiella pneumoniae]
MELLIKHLWSLVLVFFVGLIINLIKDLNRFEHK